MQEKRSFYLLLVIMGIVALSTMAVTNVILYQVAFEEKSQSLVHIAQSQARLIEAMARFNQRTNRIDWEVPIGERGPTSLLSQRAAADTIGQLRDSHQNYVGFGKTGEFVVAGVEGENIVFLLRHRESLNQDPDPIPFYSEIAEPTRRALLVQSGVMTGLDYRGETVLAAYEPVDVLHLGIVAKVDLAEIQAPFIRGFFITSIISLIVIITGSFIFRRVTNPIIENIIQREQQYRDIVENIAEWVWQTDQNGFLVYSSPIVEDILGYSPNTLLNRPLNHILASDNKHKIQGALLSNDHHSQLNDFVARVANSDGVLIDMEFSASPILSNNGDFLGYRGVARDISHRVEAERLRSEYQATLEQQVKERTQELHAINQELKTFTYIVSHDLRSPLVSIVGFTSELHTDIDTLKAKLDKLDIGDETTDNLLSIIIPDSLSFIDSAAEKMSGLINSILALSRLGVRELQIDDVDLNKLVDLNLKALAYQLEGVNVDVSPLPIVQSDETALTQIFGNILGNAVKYLRPNVQGEITIRCGESVDDWHFSIADNGRGIAEADIPFVFDLFKRVGEQNKEGDGMGLTYVQTLIRRLGGKIHCESVLGHGTIFRFSLPKRFNEDTRQEFISLG